MLLAACQPSTSDSSTTLEHERLQQEQQKIDQTNVKNCSETAQGILDRVKADNRTSVIGGSNHYSRKKSQCFMRLTIFDTQGKTWSEAQELRNAYENKVLLTCASTNTTPKYCFIPGNSSPSGKVVWLSLTDADARVEGDMNN